MRVEYVPEVMDALAADGENQAAIVGLDGRDRAARLHVIRDDARIDDGDRHNARGLGEGLVGLRLVANMRVEGHVPGRARKHLCGVRAKRGERIDHGGKRLPIDRKALRAVPGRELRLRDDHGDDVADVVRLVLGHHGVGFKRGLRTVRVCDRPQARKAAEIGEVGRDIHGLDAGNGRCGLGGPEPRSERGRAGCARNRR